MAVVVVVVGVEVEVGYLGGVTGIRDTPVSQG